MTEAPGETKLTWRAGDVPVSARFDDPYYSAGDGLAEAGHVFLEGNDLPAAWAGRGGFHIGELGFGTGLNILAARALWRATRSPGAVLCVTSFEQYPLKSPQMARALARWPELREMAQELLAVWTPAGGRFNFGDTVLEVVTGDARKTVVRWQGRVDAWFLDGFAPARNPEMWEPELMQAVHERTVRGGTAASYTAAGAVRRALVAAGFAVAKSPGFGAKREMTLARRPG
jgi:tRNA U34 5-methylaminomethyl-2-thiouridine-forming methyltransferase MnmC